MEIVVGIFHGHSNIMFFRAIQPYISELNNEVDLRAVSRITCAKYSHKIIEWIDKSAAKDSSSFILKTKQESPMGILTGRSDPPHP